MSSSFGPLDLKTKTGRSIFFKSGFHHYGWKYFIKVIWDTLTKVNIRFGHHYYNILSKEHRNMISKKMDDNY